MSAFTWPPDSPVSGAVDRTLPPGDQVPAAVLVPLFVAGEADEPHVVLTRRRADLRRHAGEISFPGGRRDAEDATLEDTALREAEEEIGLDRGHVSLIGTLPPTSTFATNYVIHPFVGTIPAGVAWRPSAKEVDAVIELPLTALRTGRTTTRLERRGISFETDAFVVDEHVIWGATARILEHLLEGLQTPGPDGRLSLA
ncbi:MAG TPA: CoA pyrophosphatase [Solirubrobacteraceae bacterium]|nr:CoA pyrophosphatase [Solirubrobacteraceae bacterium]